MLAPFEPFGVRPQPYLIPFTQADNPEISPGHGRHRLQIQIVIDNRLVEMTLQRSGRFLATGQVQLGLRELLTLSTSIYLTMGADGGSIPDRRDLVRTKGKAEVTDKALLRELFFFCALSKVRRVPSALHHSLTP